LSYRFFFVFCGQWSFCQFAETGLQKGRKKREPGRKEMEDHEADVNALQKGRTKWELGRKGRTGCGLERKGNPLGMNCTDSMLIGEEGQSVGEELGGRGVWG
jgi:hypothetical protein